VDRILLTGAITTQLTPTPDPGAAAGGACPAQACDSTVGDNGYLVDLQIQDENGDGLLVAGERITLTAAGTTNPGACVNGITQFRFFRNGAMVQDWSSSPTFTDNPTRDAAYRVQARCSLSTTCVSASTGASSNKTALIYTGDGEDVALSLRHDRASGTTTIEWASRPQVTQVSGYDLYAGAIAASGDSSARALSNAACLAGDIAQPTPVGTLVTRTESVTPTVGRVTYYLAGHSPTVTGALAALGRRSDGSVRTPPSACP
jgi:hypothetical protein